MTRELTEKERAYAVHPGNDPKYLPETLPTEKASPLKGKTIIFLGSSVTDGFAALRNSFADFLQQRDGIISIKEAVSGTTLVNDAENSYIPRMKALDPAIQADLFVCQLSTNDFTQGKEQSRIYAAIEEIIDYARSTWGCPVMFYTGTRFDCSAYGEAVEHLKEIAVRKNIGVIDLWSSKAFNAIPKETYDLYMADPIHPTMAGYRLWWLPEIERAIKEYLA